MKSNFIFKLAVFFAGYFILPTHSQGCETATGWVAYDSGKCYKVFNQLVTREQAKTICQGSGDPADLPSLVVIKSPEEQAFITKYVFEDMSVQNDVWIGLNRVFDEVENKSKYTWEDGSPMTFTNWAEGHPIEGPGSVECFKMASELSKVPSNGEWLDTGCGTSKVVLCEKLQVWTLTELKLELLKLKAEVNLNKYDTEAELEKTALELSKLKVEVSQNKNETEVELEKTALELSKLKVEVSQNKNETEVELEKTALALLNQKEETERVKQGAIPIGFLYTELPGNPAPNTLWAYANWEDVSSQFAGLFFRVLGGGSGEWDRVQSECYSRINRVRYAENVGGNTTIEIPSETGWSSPVLNGVYGSGWSYYESSEFHFEYCENRPRNYAVRVWKRVG